MQERGAEERMEVAVPPFLKVTLKGFSIFSRPRADACPEAAFISRKVALSSAQRVLDLALPRDYRGVLLLLRIWESRFSRIPQPAGALLAPS